MSEIKGAVAPNSFNGYAFVLSNNTPGTVQCWCTKVKQGPSLPSWNLSVIGDTHVKCSVLH